MKPRVYIESSVISYLTARASTDAVTAACQELTQRWWAAQLTAVDACISPYVTEEIGRGDAAAAQARLAAVASLTLLSVSDEMVDLAQYLVIGGGLPVKARLDALHISCATVHRMDVLLTWNCTHIANPTQLPVVRGLCSARGFRMPEIVTPFEMMEIRK